MCEYESNAFSEKQLIEPSLCMNNQESYAGSVGL